jgi:hypothetical protein
MTPPLPDDVVDRVQALARALTAARDALHDGRW